MTSPNKRKYERLLRWYPRWWWDMHGRVVLTTLLDVDDARGGTGPTTAEAWGLRLDGLRNRWRRPVGGRTGGSEHDSRGRRPRVRAAAAIGVVTLAITVGGGWAVASPQEGRPSEAGGTRTLAALLQAASDYEREILGDGVVTTDEYEQALLDWRNCVIETGAQPSEIYPIGDNQLTFDYEITAATDEGRMDLEATAETCLPAYFDQVGAWWVEQDPRPAPNVPLSRG